MAGAPLPSRCKYARLPNAPIGTPIEGVGLHGWLRNGLCLYRTAWLVRVRAGLRGSVRSELLDQRFDIKGTPQLGDFVVSQVDSSQRELPPGRRNTENFSEVGASQAPARCTLLESATISSMVYCWSGAAAWCHTRNCL